jgi:crossover junction endodeoxyribonuclease RuvC
MMTRELRVLGLDPGSAHTGWGLVEFAGSSLRARGWGRVSPPRAALGERLAFIVDAVQRIIGEQRPDLVALERVFHGKNARSLIVLAEARGAILAAVARSGIRIAEVTPAMVKNVVTGDGRADKRRVERMIRLQLGLGTAALPVDASDALAIAIAGRQISSAAPSTAP